MHKVMYLITESLEVNTVCVGCAAHIIGQAIENQVLVQEKIAKIEVSELIRNHNIYIENEDDESKRCGEEDHIKIGARMIELLIKYVHVQPPMDELGIAPPTRPAFVHCKTFLIRNDKKSEWKYGCIVCDPIVQKALEKTLRLILESCVCVG